jgi:hypothetical protein
MTTAKAQQSARFGLSEAEMRARLADELVRSMHIEGDQPTVHAIAHSVARILHENQLRMAEQLEGAGIVLPAAEPHDT